MDTITLVSFQAKAVYEAILRDGVYRLSKEDFLGFVNAESNYEHYHKTEKYERLMKKSGLDFAKGTMPLWAWYKEEFPTGFQEVALSLYEGTLERARKNCLGEYKEMVGLQLEVPKNEVYLTNFLNWEYFLFTEINNTHIESFNDWTQEQQGWYLADLAEADYHFSKIEEIEGDVKVQAIFPEIRMDMISGVLEEKAKLVPIS